MKCAMQGCEQDVDRWMMCGRHLQGAVNPWEVFELLPTARCNRKDCNKSATPWGYCPDHVDDFDPNRTFKIGPHFELENARLQNRRRLGLEPSAEETRIQNLIRELEDLSGRKVVLTDG